MKHRDTPNFLGEMCNVSQCYHTGMVWVPLLRMKRLALEKEPAKKNLEDSSYGMP